MAKDEAQPQIDPSIFKLEAEYMAAMIRHSEDFDRLVESVPKDKPQVVVVLKGLHHVGPDKLLDPMRLAKLKEKNEPMFREVSAYYGNFLKELLGLE